MEVDGVSCSVYSKRVTLCTSTEDSKSLEAADWFTSLTPWNPALRLDASAIVNGLLGSVVVVHRKLLYDSLKVVGAKGESAIFTWR